METPTCPWCGKEFYFDKYHGSDGTKCAVYCPNLECKFQPQADVLFDTMEQAIEAATRKENGDE